MSLNDAHAFAFSLATTLMAAIIIFQAGDGTLSVMPASEYDGDSAAISMRSILSPLDRGDTVTGAEIADDFRSRRARSCPILQTRCGGGGRRDRQTLSLRRPPP
ncbi:hypothetical protein [Rhizobium sp. CNPSo 4039]|uniref:hypothetical protein n=1 Tax=Rhizobium sp. CNPSo 4039 TaxID=3021409 RepID=UPI0025516C86|nr:hypothetical protein [Rhizobium sp. CNPSo 4039]MDK4713268.1 hypothetical protein [Rhizobium sp. CNPSo 4039]